MMIPFSFFFFFNVIGLFRNSAPTAVLYAFGRYKRSALKTIYSRAPKVFANRTEEDSAVSANRLWLCWL